MAFLSRNLILDLLLTALAPAIWGTTYIVTSQFLPPDRPFIAALLRVLPAGIALLIWSRRFPQRGEWAKLIVTGILNIGAFQALLFIAAYRLPGGLAAVIGAIQPLLVMLLAWCVDRQRSPWLAVFSAIAGILGMAMLLLSPHTVLDPLGIGAAFLGAISMALGTWLSRRWALSQARDSSARASPSSAAPSQRGGALPQTAGNQSSRASGTGPTASARLVPKIA